MHRPPPCSTLFPYTTLFRSVLIDAVAAHSKSAHHHAVLIERSAAGEEDDPILELTGRLMPVRTRVRDIVKKEVEEWSCRSEEHTSELQSRFDLVCRLLLEKK